MGLHASRLCVMVIALAASGAIYYFSFGRLNIFFVFSAFLFVIFSFIYVGRIVVLRVIFGVFLVLSLAPLTLDRPVSIYVTSLLPLNPDERLTYRFSLKDLAERQRECGAMDASLQVQGAALDRLVLAVAGAAMGRVRTNGSPQDPFMIMGVDLRLDGLGDVSVEASPMPGGRMPTILSGPETNGWGLYSDAVYLVVANSACRIVYHAEAQRMSRTIDYRRF